MSNIRYSENFKREAVKKCKLHGSISWVADLLGVQPNTLRKWLREYDGKAEALIADESS